MLNKIFSRRRNVYILAFIAIFIESFSSVCLKLAGNYPIMSKSYIIYYIATVAVMGIYAVLWQILLEYMPLTTAYLRKGISYILLYLWAFLIFHEHISVMQWIGTADCFFFADIIKEGSPKETKKFFTEIS